MTRKNLILMSTLNELPIIPVGSVVMVYDHQTKSCKLGKVDSRDYENNCSYFVKLQNGMMGVQKLSQFKTNISAISGAVNTES